MAEIYIDGLPKPEIRSIIYLNPSSLWYDPHGFVIKGRRVRSNPDEHDQPVKSCIHDWVFSDVGIEVLMERMGMGIDGDSGCANEHPEDREVDEVAELLQDAAHVDADEAGDGGRELKIGKIEIVFSRVVLGGLIPRSETAVSRNIHQAEEAETKKVIGRDVTHTTR
jgi:hypothetical protein